MTTFKEILAPHKGRVTLSTYAKINLHLSVFAKYSEAALHTLGSLFHTISLRDTLEIEPSSTFLFSLCPTTKDPRLKDDVFFIKDNLLIRTWKLLKEQYSLRGEIRITLTKRIPIGSGLGGGSSNVAALITWADQAYGLTLTHAEKTRIALQLGSDIPFFLEGGMAWVEGVGEKITPLNFSLVHLPNGYLTVVENEVAIATQEAYTRFVTYETPENYQSFKSTIQTLETSDHDERTKAEQTLKILSATAQNSFMGKTLTHYPALKNSYENLQKQSSYTLLTGSGSAFFAYTPHPLSPSEEPLSSEKARHTVHFTAVGHERVKL